MVQLDELLGTEAFTGFMDKMSETSLIDNLSGQASGFLNVTVGGIGSFIGTLTQVGITLFTTPFILYYLLKEGDKVPDNILRVLPTKIRGNMREI